jgi:hypothetical protein
MADPKVLDFSAEEEEVITIKFPNGKTCELPTMEELTMPVYQFLATNGEEWYELFDKDEQTDDEKTRFEHLNNRLSYSLCDVPQETVDLLNERQKAKIIVSFMTASPELLSLAQQMSNVGEQKPKPRERQSKPKPRKKTTAR